MENFKRTAALFVLAFMSFCLPLLVSPAWAQGQLPSDATQKPTSGDDDSFDSGDQTDSYYMKLAASGSLRDIQYAYEDNKKAFTTDFYGEERETFLMLVLKNDREYSIIKFCLDVDTKVRDRVANGDRTPLMYAARYCTDERVITMILKNSSLFAQNRRAHVLQQDRKGYDAFAYSRNNPNFKVYMELYKYAPDSGITMAPQDDPSYPKSKASSAGSLGTSGKSNTRTTTPPPASPSEGAAPPPPPATAGSATPPPSRNTDTQEEILPAQRYMR